MTRHRIRRTAKARRMRPAKPPIADPGPIRPMDSEDQAGTYAPIHSPGDTGENDDGVLAQGPQPPRRRRAPVNRRKEVHR